MSVENKLALYWQQKGVGMAMRTDNPTGYYQTFLQNYDEVTSEVGSAKELLGVCSIAYETFVNDKWCEAYQRTFKHLGVER